MKGGIVMMWVIIGTMMGATVGFLIAALLNAASMEDRRDDMYCAKCGRTLKGQSSIDRGYGPVCYRKMFPEQFTGKTNKGIAIEREIYDIPGQMDISDFIDMPK